MTYYTNRRDIRELSPRRNPKTLHPARRVMRRPQVKTCAPEFYVRGYGATHVGCKRRANEDSFWMIPQNCLWIVADGMGGHAGGQIASTIAVQEMGRQAIQLLTKEEQKSGPVDITYVLSRATACANEEVTRQTDQHPELNNMGSTLTSLMIYGETAYLAHIGDSRAYLIRDQQLIQVTEDHSYVQELVNFGHITPDEALTHYRRNLILKSISRNSDTFDIAPDIAAVPLRSGDRFLLCSDGLIEHVRDADILKTIIEEGSQRTPDILIEKANSKDYASPSGIGTDNTTIIVVEVKGRRKNRRRTQSR